MIVVRLSAIYTGDKWWVAWILYIDQLQKKINILNIGDTFELKNLFSSIEWDNTGDNGKKNSLGKIFKKLVNNKIIKNANYNKRLSSNHAQYIRV